MASVVAATIVSALGATGFAATVLKFAVAAAFTLAANFALSALSKKPKKPDFSQRDNVVTVRQPTVAWEYVYGTMRKGGSYAFIHSTHSDNYLHLVIILADREVNAIDDVYFDDEVVPLDESGNATGKYAGVARIIKRLGEVDQSAIQELIDDAPDKWTADHRLASKAYIYVRLKYSSSKFPNGIPNISALIKGHKVFDIRDAAQDISDPDTWIYSESPPLCIADYLRDTDIGMSAGDGVVDNELISASNACDETVPLKDGGTEPRYTCNGIVSSEPSHKDTLQGMLTSMNGDIVSTGAIWKLYAGVWRAPSHALNEDDLRGPVRTNTLRTADQKYNGVRGVYVSPDNHYQPADFPAVTSAAMIALDGQENFLDIELPFTNSSSIAQRIAKQKLLESRQDVSTNWPCKLKAWAIQSLDNIMLSRERLGWTNKVFKVTRAPTVLDGGALGIDLALEETDPSIYDWTTDEEITVDPAPNTNLPNPFNVSPPENVIVQSGSAQTRIDSAGQVISQLKIIITPPDNAFIERYRVAWKLNDGSDWNEYLIPANQDSTTQTVVEPVIDGRTYLVRVSGISTFNVESDYASALPHVVIGKQEKPGDVSQFLVGMQPDGTREFNTIHENPDPDVRVGGGYEILFQSGLSIDIQTASKLNKGLIKTWPYETNQLPAGTYTFALVVVDSSGNRSENPLIVTATLGNPRLRAAIHWQNDRDLGWPGTTTDCFINHENYLEAVGIGTWDDLPDTWDELTDEWQDIVPSQSPIIYETGIIDLGTDIAFNPLVTVDGQGTSNIEMRCATNVEGDDLSGKIWELPVQGIKRYIQFRVSMTGPSPVISGVRIILDGEILSDDLQDINTGLPSAGLFERIGVGHFKVATSKNISVLTSANIAAFQQTGPGYSSELISKSTTITGGALAAEFKIYDANDNPADAVVDIVLKGPAEVS